MKPNVTERVLVLGREGLARDQLVNALTDLGVKPVWIGVPAQSNPELLGELSPNKIIVSLEPAIELELEPYGEWLSQPGITVLYDDAETTRSLSGWDLNRWARHMAAKLLDRDVLPALSINDSMADTNLELAVTEVPSAVEPDEYDWQSSDQYETLEINVEELDAAIAKLNSTLTSELDETQIIQHNFEHINPVSESEFSIMDSTPPEKKATQHLNYSMSDLGTDLGFEKKADNASVTELSDNEMFKIMEDAATSAENLDIGSQYTPDNKNAMANNGELSLTAMDAEIAQVAMTTGATGMDLNEFDLSKYSLLDEDADLQNTSSKDSRQLFLVVSGIGGPGVIRDMLEVVSSDFSKIFVLSQIIDVKQLEPLKSQLQKVAKVPVLILQADEYLKNGNVYMLPPNHIIQISALGYQCISGSNLSVFIDQMDQATEILILSGADKSLSQSLIQVSSQLKNIHVQNPVDCFEPELIQQLVNIGAPVLNRDAMVTWFN